MIWPYAMYPLWTVKWYLCCHSCAADCGSLAHWVNKRSTLDSAHNWHPSFQCGPGVLFVSFATNQDEVIIVRSPYEVNQQSFQSLRNANAVLSTAPFDKSAARVKMKAWDMCCSYAHPQLELQPGFWFWDQDAGCWIMRQQWGSQVPKAIEFHAIASSCVICRPIPKAEAATSFHPKVKSKVWPEIHQSYQSPWFSWICLTKRLLIWRGLNLKKNALASTGRIHWCSNWSCSIWQERCGPAAPAPSCRAWAF